MKQIWLTNYLQKENYVSEYTKREGVETLHERQCLHQKHTKQTMPPSKTHKNRQKCSNLRREVNGQRNCESGNKGRPQIMWRGRKHRPSHAHQILNDSYCGNYDLHYKGGGGQNPISWTSNSFSSRLQLHTWFVPNFDQYLACKSPFWLHNLSSIIFQVCFLCFVLIMFPVTLCFLF